MLTFKVKITIDSLLSDRHQVLSVGKLFEPIGEESLQPRVVSILLRLCVQEVFRKPNVNRCVYIYIYRLYRYIDIYSTYGK